MQIFLFSYKISGQSLALFPFLSVIYYLIIPYFTTDFNIFVAYLQLFIPGPYLLLRMILKNKFNKKVTFLQFWHRFLLTKGQKTYIMIVYVLIQEDGYEKQCSENHKG